MHNKNKSSERISKLGEEVILNRLKKYMDDGQIDDDTALITALNKEIIINTDILVENIHFNKITSSPQNTGWKGVTANLSDLACSGVEDILGITVGLVVPGNTQWNWIEGVYEGINNALNQFGGKILGGDCSKGKQKILSITAIGTKGPLNLHRSNAKPGDILVTSGVHGLSKLGLELLLSDPFTTSFDLCEAVKERAIKAHQEPQPPLKALNKLISCKPKELPFKAAATDSSDGLLEAIECICKSSNCSAILEKKHIPIDKALPKEKHWTEWCLEGGEDFELIVSLPPPWAEAWLKSMPSTKAIGKIEKGLPQLRWSNGTKIQRKPTFKHF